MLNWQMNQKKRQRTPYLKTYVCVTLGIFFFNILRFTLSLKLIIFINRVLVIPMSARKKVKCQWCQHVSYFLRFVLRDFVMQGD